MVDRSIGRAAGLGLVGLMALALTGTLEIGHSAVAAAAGRSDAIYRWGTTPTLQSLPAGVTPVAVSDGFATGYAIGSDGKLYAWGANDNGELGDGAGQSIDDAPVVVLLPSGVGPTAIAGGPDDGYAIGSDGHVYAWGFNAQGELGVGTLKGPDACSVNGPGQPGLTRPCSTTPVRVDLPPRVRAVAVATSGDPQPGSAYALGRNGKVYAWGNNQDALGDGGSRNHVRPRVVPLPSGVRATAIAGAGMDGYAIGTDGNLYAWGDNIFGELGNGTTDSSGTPVRVSLPSGVSPRSIAGSISNGFGTAYMIGSDGKEYAWGFNGDGELGNGAPGPQSCPDQGIVYQCSTTPVLVALPVGVTPTQIAGNYDGGSAIGSDHRVYSWGRYNLGNGSSGGSDTPVAVSLPSGSIPEALGQGPSSQASYAIVDMPGT
jgi:alpha-tubulin suppressor-like RCC1 family protein